MSYAKKIFLLLFIPSLYLIWTFVLELLACSAILSKKNVRKVKSTLTRFLGTSTTLKKITRFSGDLTFEKNFTLFFFLKKTLKYFCYEKNLLKTTI